ncbi:MAG TPA: SRPBCC family protein [Actinomycetota bacterium]|nr:SRPBCC family protein [Actinomycetota bacterium]
MSTVRVRRRGPASKYAIWARYRNLERWPEWAPHIRELRAFGQLRPGLEGQMVGVLGMTAWFEVLEVDEPGGVWIWVVRSGPAKLRIEHEVAEGLAGMIITGRAPAVFAYVPVARRQLTRVVGPGRGP